jgi:hypothetical protein
MKTFAQIWYATPGRARSRSKWLVYDDVGTLSIDGTQFSFQGNSTRLERQILESAVLTRQRVNIVTYLLVCLVAFLPYALIAYGVHLIFHVPVIIVLVACYSVVPIGLGIGLSTKWIRIRFSSEQGEPGEAYFADGGSQGWRGIFGGTRRVFCEIHLG